LKNIKTRRRGKQLEDDILKVVWDQLGKTGYENLSMTRIAQLAGTNKNTIYRRWPKKVTLVMAVLERHAPKLTLKTNLTGDLRMDLITALSAITPIFSVASPQTFQGVIADNIVNIGAQTFLSAINGENLITQQIEYVLNQFKGNSLITSRQKKLPSLLMINEVLQYGVLTTTSIRKIVDEELMPVFKQALM
jgi:AcrR family transcriptional regulator